MFYKDGSLFTESEIKALNPNTSFPTPFVAPSDYAVVFETPMPTAGELQVAYQDGTEVDSKGNRVIKWSIRDMFEDTPEKTKAEQEAEYLEAKRKALVPTQITPLQAKLQLLDMELLDEVEAMVDADRRVALYWNEALEIRRDHPTLLQMATALGLTELQVDEMFMEASKLQ